MSSAPPQQSAPLLHSNRPSNNANQSLLLRILLLLALVVRILLYPIRVLSDRLFPPRDTDGLAPAVTAKAAQQFVVFLQSLSSGERIGRHWSTLGFVALKHEAMTTQSLIFVYLHAPLHSETKSYCQTVLNREPMLSFLQQERVLPVGYSIHTAQGAQLQDMLQITSFPAIAVLQPSGNSTLQLMLKAQGIRQCRPHYLLPLLQTLLQRHQITLSELEMRRLQRQQESDLRRQQDDEYQATLQADQERELRAAAERDAVLAAAAAEQEAAHRAERAAAEAWQAAKDLLRPEPEPHDPQATVLRFVLPSGTKLNRRFGADESVAAVRAFLQIYCVEHDLSLRNIGISTNFPRQTFSVEEDGKTLREVGLVPQAVLMLQDLDA